MRGFLDVPAHAGWGKLTGASVETWRAVRANCERLIALKQLTIDELKTLIFYADVAERGVDPSSVKHYTFVASDLTASASQRLRQDHSRLIVYTRAYLQDGSFVILDPPVPVPPVKKGTPSGVPETTVDQPRSES